MSSNKLTLAGKEYTFEAYTIDQLERIGDLAEEFGDRPSKVVFATFGIAMENASPAVAEPRKMRITAEEMGKVIQLVNELSGLKAEVADGAAAGEPRPKA